MLSGSKKKELRYAFYFFLKIPSNQTPSSFPQQGPYGDSCPFTGAFFYTSFKFLIKKYNKFSL